MKITNNQLFAAHNYLAELKLAKFDKDIRVAIFKNVGELSSATKNVQDKMETSKKELFKDIEEDAQKVAILREEFNKKDTGEERKIEIIKELELYKDVFKAERDFIEITNKYGNDEIDIKLVTIDFDKFVDGLVESDIEFTAIGLQRIAFLFNKIK